MTRMRMLGSMKRVGGSACSAAVVGLLLVSLFESFCFAADDKPAPPERKVTELTLTPARLPEPALRLRLMTPHFERTSGNAAQFYYRALSQFKNLTADQRKRLDELTDLPLAEIGKNQEEVTNLLSACQSALGEFQVATSRESCNWDYRLRELQGLQVVAFILEETQSLRQFSRVLSLKAKHEILERRFEDAQETIRMGLQAARDVSLESFLIGKLIGVAISLQMLERLDELAQVSGSPNQYWALARLPHPLIDVRDALEFEMYTSYQIFPVLRDVPQTERAEAEWDRLVSQLLESLDQLLEVADPGTESKRSTKSGVEQLRELAPRARTELVAFGVDEARRRSLSDGQAVAWHISATYELARDELFQWAFVPSSESWSRMMNAERSLIQRGYLRPKPEKELVPLAGQLLPAVLKASLAPARLERRVAERHIIEALRDYLAVHGRLPEELTQIERCIVPRDPISGESFVYRRNGDAFILGAPAHATDELSPTSLRQYRVHASQQ